MRVLIVATLLFFNVALAWWHQTGAGRPATPQTVPLTEPGVAPLVLRQEHEAADPDPPSPPPAGLPAARRTGG